MNRVIHACSQATFRWRGGPFPGHAGIEQNLDTTRTATPFTAYASFTLLSPTSFLARTPKNRLPNFT